MTTSGIYRIVNTTNGCTYIGQSDDVLQRWRQHRWLLNHHRHDNKKLQEDWARTADKSKFSFEFLQEVVLESDRLRAERAALDAVPVDLRYNVGEAGTLAVTLGAERTAEQRLNISRAGGGRPFFAKNRTTGEIRRFAHTGEAVDVGFSRSKVLTCLYGQTPSHKDHVFYYDESFVPPPPKEKKAPRMDRSPRAVIGTSPEGVDKHYNSISSVEQDGFQRPGVSKCLAGLMQRSGGWTWRYADGLPHRSMPEDLREGLKGVDRKSLTK